jgi:hypothetical protein
MKNLIKISLLSIAIASSAASAYPAIYCPQTIHCEYGKCEIGSDNFIMSYIPRPIVDGDYIFRKSSTRTLDPSPAECEYVISGEEIHNFSIHSKNALSPGVNIIPNAWTKLSDYTYECSYPSKFCPLIKLFP